MFRPGAYRRALKHLTAMLHVVGHTTALQLNRRQRFETFGPWPHGPARAYLGGWRPPGDPAGVCRAHGSQSRGRDFVVCIS